MLDTARPTALPVSIAAIPEALRAIPHWLLWEYAWRQGRWTKVPYRAGTPRCPAAVDQPATWCPFAEALAWHGRGYGDGLGFVLTAALGLVGIDLDYCRDADPGALDPWAVAIVQAIRSYAEVTPSGTGVRIFARGTLPPHGRKCGDVEMCTEGRYLTVTGCHLADTPATLAERHEAIAALHRRIFAARQPLAAPLDGDGDGPPLDDDALLARALGAANGGKLARLWAGETRGYPSHSEADLALCSMLAF